MKDNKYFTIKEISEAWLKFNRPKYFVNSTNEDENFGDIEKLKPGTAIMTRGIIDVKMIDVDYSQWIAYLISEKWRDNEKA
jgi:hypothetical protein